MSTTTVAAAPADTHPHQRAAELSAFRLNAVLVGLASVLIGLPYLAAGSSDATALAAYLTGQAMLIGLLWRRRNPRLMLLIVTIAGIMQMLTVPWPTLFLVAIPVAVYSYARWIEGRPRLVLVIGFAASVLGPLSWVRSLYGPYTRGETPYSYDVTSYVLFVLVCAGLVVTPYAFGRRVRDAATVQEARLNAERERYAEAIRTRAHHTRIAEMNTRAQIARELHDIVAHSVSVMIVQAEGGKAVAAKNPQAAADVLETIADTGRDALTEMRRLVGVLRGGPEQHPDYAPTPALADLSTMVDRAGERVSLTVHGEQPNLSPTLQLTLFRLAQEGVTNFLKHAGPEATCEVTLTYRIDQVVLSVVDNGLGAAASSDGAGHGLRGMHERVQAMGGRLETRPLDPGFLVRASFPLRPTTSPIFPGGPR